MYALIIHDRADEDAKLKFKTFREAVEHTRMVIIPQIAEAVRNTLEQDDPRPWFEDSKELLELVEELYPERNENGEKRFEAAVERWEKFAKHDNYGDMWVTFI